MATIVRDSMPDLYLSLLANLDQVIYDKFEIPAEGMQFYNFRKGYGPFIQDTTVSGFGTVPVKAESAEAATDQIYQGFDKKYTPVVYELMYSVSREAVDDQKWIQLAKSAKALQRSFRYTKEVYLARPFNVGFDTLTSADGQYIFSSSHSKLPSGTQSNTVSADLSVTSLQTAINTFEATTDYRGLLLLLSAGRLVVPPESYWLAAEIVNSPDRPDTASRSINALFNEGLKVIKYKYLTDSDSFYLLPPTNDQHDLNYIEWDAFETFADKDFKTDDLLYKGRERYIYGVTDWTGLYGSPGV